VLLEAFVICHLTILAIIKPAMMMRRAFRMERRGISTGDSSSRGTVTVELRRVLGSILTTS
jgi:hypothetical protein